MTITKASEIRLKCKLEKYIYIYTVLLLLKFASNLIKLSSYQTKKILCFFNHIRKQVEV